MNPCNFRVLDPWFHIKRHGFLHTLQFAGTSHELHVLYSSGSRQGTEQLNVEVSREWISCRNATNTANGTMSTVAVPVLFTGQYKLRGLTITDHDFLSHFRAVWKRTSCTMKCTSLAWAALSGSPDSQPQRQSSLSATQGRRAKFNLWSESLAHFQTWKNLSVQQGRSEEMKTG